ncbi:MAG: hypothetical protein ACPG06_10885 [Alphaproteobacteria bacterium]
MNGLLMRIQVALPKDAEILILLKPACKYVIIDPAFGLLETFWQARYLGYTTTVSS